MPFQIEVLVEINKDGDKEWRSVRPSDKEPPYRYATREQAEAMRRLCYGSRYTANAWGAESDEVTNRVSECPSHDYCKRCGRPVGDPIHGIDPEIQHSWEDPSLA